MDEHQENRRQATRRNTGPVRRLENGMLDVTRKTGKHVKA